MSIRTVINKHYKHSDNPKPIWGIERKVTTVVYEFDCINLNTWEKVGKTTLLWKHDSEEVHPAKNPVYHGCSWRFMDYNPTPVTDWFLGLPPKQMFKWCKEHGLTNMRVVGKYTDIYFSDACHWDSCNGEWVF